MKSILPLGIILVSAIALNSCASMNNLAQTKTIGDDVYYTKAKAGDSFDPEPQYTQNSYTNNDDYYYYGDYKSRIDRFSYLTPFDYDDDFYYDYASNDYSIPVNTSVAEPIDDGYYADAYDDLGVYSAFDFGYGDFGGYDNYGYGVAYSSYIYSGGGRISHKRSYDRDRNFNGKFSRSNSGSLVFNKTGVSSGSRTAPSTGLSFSRTNGTSANNNNTAYSGGRRPGGSYAVYPGRPGTNSTAYVNPTGNGSRIIRQDNQNQRPVIQQPQTVERYSPPPSTSSSSSSGNSGSSGGGAASGGGGGRPVRP